MAESKTCTFDPCDKPAVSRGLCRGHTYQRDSGKPLTPIYRGDREGYFWAHVEKAGPDECWLWAGRTHDPFGHGVIDIGKTSTGAHRFSWELANGPIPAGLHVRHTCDVPACVNPAHLVVGTHQDNMQDMMERQRQRRGESHPRARFTEDDIRSIRERAANGEGIRAIARSYGCDHKAISSIVHRRTWKHVA